MYSQVALGFTNAQTGFLWHKVDTGLFKNPRLNLDVPATQQVKGSTTVMFLGCGARLVSHELSNHSGRNLNPFP